MVSSLRKSICWDVFCPGVVSDGVIVLGQEFYGSNLVRGEVGLSGYVGEGLVVSDDFKGLSSIAPNRSLVIFAGTPFVSGPFTIMYSSQSVPLGTC